MERAIGIEHTFETLEVSAVSLKRRGAVILEAKKATTVPSFVPTTEPYQVLPVAAIRA
jgi:hypothetical protein